MLYTYGYKHALRICNIFAFPLQQKLHERALMLLYKYVTCLIVTETESVRDTDLIFKIIEVNLSL
jgi:hypothetical protein